MTSTAASSSFSLLMVLIRVTWLLTSCARSLSPVDTTTFMPAAAACTAKVPITSSASTPSTIRIGQPMARTASWMGSICRRRSSGIEARVSLYSGYMSSRKVFPLASKTQAI
ncbi:hypothetical protein D3C72_1678790 [compost metagenome]